MMMISSDDCEGAIETIEILSDKNAVKRVKEAKREIAEGKTVSLEKLRNKIENEKK